MDLTQLANLGEFIGGVAVLVTLVYLALQVRQNTKLAVTSNHAAMVADLRSANRAIAEDASLADLMLRGENALGELSEVDSRRFEEFAISQITLWEQAFHGWRQNTIDDDTWGGWDEYGRERFSTAGHQKVFNKNRLSFFSLFRNHLEQDVFGLSHVDANS